MKLERYRVVKLDDADIWAVVDTAPDEPLDGQYVLLQPDFGGDRAGTDVDGPWFTNRLEAVRYATYREACAAEEAGFTSLAAKFYEQADEITTS